MTKRTKTIGSDTWEWEETPEVKEALKKLQQFKNYQRTRT